MTPFASALYFGLVAYAAVPTLLLGLSGRLRGWWIIVVSVAMLVVQLGWAGSLGVAAGCLLFQLGVTLGYQAMRRRSIVVPVWIPVMFALLPLMVARLTGLTMTTSPFGFLGLSYVTFRILDAILGLHDRTIKELDPVALVAFALFFPPFTSGPIDRYRRFLADFRRAPDRETYLDLLEEAVPLMIRGLLYKFVVAALVKNRLVDVFAERHDLLGTAGYMYAYTAYLFFDFAGYSAMAMAISRVMGIATPPNFDRPFLARNIAEFWNRWHISLSNWFRDHVYMRFVLASKRGKWFKDRFLPSYIALFLSFGLMGVWHGLEAHYLVYGVYHAALLIGHGLFVRWNEPRHWWGESRPWRVAGTLITIQAFCFGLLIFSGRLFG